MRLKIMDLVLAVFFICAAAIVCAVSIELFAARKEPQQAAPQKTISDLEVPSIPEGPAQTEPVPETVVPQPLTALGVNEQSYNETKEQTQTTQPEQDPRYNDPKFKEQMGRNALAYIGHNPEADAVWIQVINDPTLSANARQNLIEDLNEDGLSNPRSPTADDLPVILYRIELIEQLAPNAMDQINADAFQEAYKDLLNLAARLGAI